MTLPARCSTCRYPAALPAHAQPALNTQPSAAGQSAAVLTCPGPVAAAAGTLGEHRHTEATLPAGSACLLASLQGSAQTMVISTGSGLQCRASFWQKHAQCLPTGQETCLTSLHGRSAQSGASPLLTWAMHCACSVSCCKHTPALAWGRTRHAWTYSVHGLAGITALAVQAIIAPHSLSSSPDSASSQPRSARLPLPSTNASGCPVPCSSRLVLPQTRLSGVLVVT